MGVAIVTGAARGIGAATARALAADGHRLVLVDRCDDDPRLDYALATRSELDAVASELDAVAVVGDVADPDVIREAVDAAAALGELTIAVAAAGVIAGDGPAWEATDEAWTAVIDTNLTGVRRLAAATIPVMVEAPWPPTGRFVAVGSPVAHKATFHLAAYASSKAAVESYVRSLAADLAGTRITANVVLPGSTETELLGFSARVYELDHPRQFAQHHITERLVDPDEVAAAIAWLCSSAAGSITGAAIPVDGGFSAR